MNNKYWRTIVHDAIFANYLAIQELDIRGFKVDERNLALTALKNILRRSFTYDEFKESIYLHGSLMSTGHIYLRLMMKEIEERIGADNEDE